MLRVSIRNSDSGVSIWWPLCKSLYLSLQRTFISVPIPVWDKLYCRLITKSPHFPLFQVGNSSDGPSQNSPSSIFDLCAGAPEVIFVASWRPSPPHCSISRAEPRKQKKHSTYTCVRLADDCLCCHVVCMSFSFFFFFLICKTKQQHQRKIWQACDLRKNVKVKRIKSKWWPPYFFLCVTLFHIHSFIYSFRRVLVSSHNNVSAARPEEVVNIQTQSGWKPDCSKDNTAQSVEASECSQTLLCMSWWIES